MHTRPLLPHEQDSSLVGAVVSAIATAAGILHHEVDEKVGADGGHVGDEEGAVDLRGDVGRRIIPYHRVPVGPFAAMDAHFVVEDCPRDIREGKLKIFSVNCKLQYTPPRSTTPVDKGFISTMGSSTVKWIME